MINIPDWLNQIIVFLAVVNIIFFSIWFIQLRRSNSPVVQGLVDFVLVMNAYLIWSWLARTDDIWEQQGGDFIENVHLLYYFRSFLWVPHLLIVLLLLRLRWRIYKQTKGGK